MDSREKKIKHQKWQRWFMLRPWQRHSLVLAVGGFVYIFIGTAFLTIEEISERRERALQIALDVLPLNVWAYIFIAVGLLAVASSRWPSFAETWGYMVLTGLSSAWAGTYFLSYLISDAPTSNISYGLVWGLIAFMWWAISGLVNPEKVMAVVDDNGSD